MGNRKRLNEREVEVVDAINLLRSTHKSFINKDLPNHNHHDIWFACDTLVREGKLFRQKVSHKTLRYYFNEADANTAIAEERSKPAPVTIKAGRFSSDAKVIYPPGLKVQYGPSPKLDHFHTNTHWQM